MNKKLNAVLRILTIAAAGFGCYAAFTLKGKMDAALTKTAWAVTDPEIKAGKEYDARMASLASAKAIIDAKRAAIIELETSKKDLQADVADKKTKIEGLTTQNTALEGERAELTRKRDEAVAQLTDANSKKDSAVAELATAKEELVKATEKAAGMFTKEQLAETEAKVTKAEEKAEAIRSKYVGLHTWAARAAESATPGGFQRDPFAEPAKEGSPGTTAVAAAVESVTESVLTKIVDIDTKTGIVAFSVGESNGIKEKSVFDVRVDGKKIGKVQIASAKASLSFGQIQPEKDLNLGAFSRGGIVSLVPANKLASN
jgi:hypothetical protein